MGVVPNNFTGEVAGQVEGWVMRVIEARSVRSLKSSEIQEIVGYVIERFFNAIKEYKLSNKGLLLLSELRKGNSKS